MPDLPADGLFRRYWDIYRLLVRREGLWGATTFFLRGVRGLMLERFRLAGDPNRTAQHEAIWIGLFGGALASGIFLLFTQRGTLNHVAGWLLIGVAAYIALAFFLPFPLPRVRDAELIKQRREAARRRREATLSAMYAALREIEEEREAESE